MATLRPVTLAELPEAPLLVEVTSPIAASRLRVFDLLSGDPARWGDFLPGLDHNGFWVKQTPDGVGAIRCFGGGKVRVTETILVKDDATRWAFRVDAATIPLAKAIIEDYQLADSLDGCTLHWTGAIWPHGSAALARSILAPVVTRIVRRLARGIERAAT